MKRAETAPSWDRAQLTLPFCAVIDFAEAAERIRRRRAQEILRQIAQKISGDAA